MSVVDVLHCGVLMLCWTRLCVAPQASDGQQLAPALDPTRTGDHHTTSSAETGEIKDHHAPCLVDDTLAALREGVGVDGELTNRSLTLFGICPAFGNSSGSVLRDLAEKTSRNQKNGLEVLLPIKVMLTEEDESATLELTFDLPQSPLLETDPVLLLALESPVAGENLDVTFTSQSLQPDTQAVCISGETQYIALMGKASEYNFQKKWRISADMKSPDMKQNLKDILTGGKSGSNIGPTPLLIFAVERGTETRYTHVLASSQTSSFLCELKRLLSDVLPRAHPKSPPVQLSSLPSLPPLTLGPSSSETLLAALINSTAPTIFSFAARGSAFQAQRGELALSPPLLEELRQRLEVTAVQMKVVTREESLGDRATERLERLKELCDFPKTGPAAGVRQYHAFLLLKALQTVAHAYEVQRRLRPTRADPNNPQEDTSCGLRSLTVSLERHLVGPNTANINNCHGSCADSTNNHVRLLNFHIGSGNVGERAPCCVPVAYEALHVAEFNGHGTYLSIKPDMVAKECGCR